VTTRTHFTFRIDTWTPDGEGIVEHLADRGSTYRRGNSVQTTAATSLLLSAVVLRTNETLNGVLRLKADAAGTLMNELEAKLKPLPARQAPPYISRAAIDRRASRGRDQHPPNDHRREKSRFIQALPKLGCMAPHNVAD